MVRSISAKRPRLSEGPSDSCEIRPSPPWASWALLLPMAKPSPSRMLLDELPMRQSELEYAEMLSRRAHSRHICDPERRSLRSNYQRKLVGRDGIEPPTPGFSVLSLGIANDAEVLALLANFASRSLRLSALEYSRMLLTGTQLGHNSNSARF